MKSIKLKLVILYLTLVFIVMLVSSTFMLAQVRSGETTKANEQLADYAIQINEQIVQLYPPDEFDNAFSKMSFLTSRIKAYILNQNGQTISPPSSVGEDFRDSVVISALSGVAKFSGMDKDKVADSQGRIRTWFSYALPVSKNDTQFVVLVRMDAQDVTENLSDMTITIFFMVLLALVLTCVLGVLFTSTLTGPIIALTKKAKEMAQGNLDQQIPVNSRDEIGQLTESFNNMASELSATVSTMASEKNKMEVVLHNMTDGVLAYDTNGALIHANSSCYELLNQDQIEGIPMTKMLDDLGFNAVDIASMLPDDFKESTLSSGDKFISAGITPYLNTSGKVSGVIIVLQDVTKLKKLDNMRKEFVANVSHELRTPLTTVKTYTETLMEGALDDRETAVNFLKTIISETERMTLLVRDLLELSRFDNQQLKLELEVLDLVGLLKQCIRQNMLMAEQKKQQIRFTSPERQFFIEGDAGRINQVLTNIITNAIKYSPENADIEIFTDETEKYYRVYIMDNGIGIPKEDIKQIFERFYRVDKARSRAMGGTGLGLAIAREIIEAHNGKITAHSELGKGTTMIVRFNKYEDV